MEGGALAGREGVVFEVVVPHHPLHALQVYNLAMVPLEDQGMRGLVVREPVAIFLSLPRILKHNKVNCKVQ